MAVDSPIDSSGKAEVSSLPPSDPNSKGGPSNDLSGGSTPDISKLLNEDINDRKGLRTLRKVAFYGAGVLILVTFAALFLWVYHIGTHVTDVSVTTTYRVSFFVAPVIVLATLGALLTLALLKFAFRPAEKSKDDEPSPISLMQALGTQVIDLLKAYFGKKGE